MSKIHIKIIYLFILYFYRCPFNPSMVFVFFYPEQAIKCYKDSWFEHGLGSSLFVLTVRAWVCVCVSII